MTLVSRDQNSAVDSGVKLISYGFTILFVVAGPAQQYITPWFRELGNVNVGYEVLLLIYLLFALGSVVSGLMVARWGEKRTMVAASVIYLVFCGTLGVGNVLLAYLLATATGVAAAGLWTSQVLFLTRVSNDRTRAGNSAFFWMLFPVGSGVGALMFAALLGLGCSYPVTFVSMSALGLVAVWVFCRLPGRRTAGRDVSHEEAIALPATNPTSLRCSLLAIAQRCVYGLIIARVPLQIQSVVGDAFIGLMCAPFFVLPLVLSRQSGKLLDTKGRFRMAAFGAMLSVASLVLFQIARDIWTLSAAIVVATGASVILNPLLNALPGDISDEHCRARVGVLFSFFASLGTLLGLIASRFFTGSGAFGLCAVIGLVCFVVSIRTLRQGIKQVRNLVCEELRQKPLQRREC